MLQNRKSQKKILIVIGSEEVKQNLTELLQKNNYNVVAAPNGYDGYKYAISSPPNLIIADIIIPKMNGLEMLKLVRDNSSTSEIPFIFLTEKAATIDRRAAMNSGADDFLSIPFKNDDILNSIKIRLEKKEKIDLKFNKVFKSISGKIPHELRTPLTSIIGFTNSMMEEINTLTKNEMIDMLYTIKSASLRLHRTIEKFIIFSAAEMINMDKTSHEHLLSKVTEVNAFLFYPVINQKTNSEDKSPTINLNTSVGKVMITEEHFNIITAELIENAVKFSYPNRPIDIYSEEDENTYTIVIKNYGRGMTEEEINSLAPFKQFRRTKYEQQGNGLGLMIVSNLSNFYNIEFNLSSVLNEYTSASVRFRKHKSVSILTKN